MSSDKTCFKIKSSKIRPHGISNVVICKNDNGIVSIAVDADENANRGTVMFEISLLMKVDGCTATAELSIMPISNGDDEPF